MLNENRDLHVYHFRELIKMRKIAHKMPFSCENARAKNWVNLGAPNVCSRASR